MESKTAMQLRTIANRLYGIRLPAIETEAINSILASAGDLLKIAVRMENEAIQPVGEEPEDEPKE